MAAVAAGGGGEGGHAALCRGAAFGGTKCGILKFGRFYSELAFALQNRFGWNLHYVITPPTRDSPRQSHRCNHKNINGRSDWRGGNKTFAPGGKYPRAATAWQPRHDGPDAETITDAADVVDVDAVTCMHR